MSGGYFDYKQYEIQHMADEIEQVLLENKEDFGPGTLITFHNIIKLLRASYVGIRRVDWLLSGDDGEETFHERMKEDLEDINVKYTGTVEE